MIILKPNNQEQIFKVLPRTNSVPASDFTFKVIDVITGSEVFVGSSEIEREADFLKVTATYGTEVGSVELIEGRFYRLEIRNDNKIYYKDRIFVTDQTFTQLDQSYDINENVYTEQETSDNDYIMI